MLTLFYYTITGFLFSLNFGPSDLELYAVNLRSHLINIAIDIMKELLLIIGLQLPLVSIFLISLGEAEA